jgi:hypothetical protein
MFWNLIPTTVGSIIYDGTLQIVHVLPLSQGLPHSDEADQTIRTNFSEYTLNPPANPISLTVKFKYNLYIITAVLQHLQKLKTGTSFSNDVVLAWVIKTTARKLYLSNIIMIKEEGCHQNNKN